MPILCCFPLARFQKVHIAGARDIARMKISAIASRGTKRDFVDLYASAQRWELARFNSSCSIERPPIADG
jgi:hypothetical protein